MRSLRVDQFHFRSISPARFELINQSLWKAKLATASADVDANVDVDADANANANANASANASLGPKSGRLKRRPRSHVVDASSRSLIDFCHVTSDRKL